MIAIICGDDQGSSRKKYHDLRKEYESAQNTIVELTEEKLDQLDKWLFDSTHLFSEKKAFFGENLLSKKEHRELLKKYDETTSAAEFVFWEENLEEREVKFMFKTAKIFSFKLPNTIFKFLDAIYPTNLKPAIFALQNLSNEIVDPVILFMLTRRVRELLLVKLGEAASLKQADWQLARLKQQAGKWSEEKLVSFYEALYRVEVNGKTGRAYYSTRKALDILFCYYL